ncbi:magnesium transporter NIPA-domain-containing protein [Talaromyces proteolyticus]|uniref:Magnesium transporter NIPA-domain-containing protein n=1 Tax=Talaromyces proteolyticus TaxID=1131652 RepID=A0AAD4KY85_9EURO|nr:magnesium transporter NIPA-domain-containing protein [Talaromyces proteolyticus]KAH8702460.1 magnesium transporter NIPA-domain-containing protein [Talaromyces proteolyticus]
MDGILSTGVSTVQLPPATGFPAASSLPNTYSLLSLLIGSQEDSDGDGGHQAQRWSSFIGIIVAICGNILISFALNIQRYAHVRIEREAEGERVRMRSRRHVSTSTYGSTDVPYRDDPGDNSNETFGATQNGRERSDDQDRSYQDYDTENEDPDMQQSILSDQTVRPGDKDLAETYRANYLHSPYWWAGIVLMTLGEMGNFLAYGFAPASIVSPLGVVALISNCVIAPFMLKEKFRQQDLWGVLIAITGAVVVVLSAETSETKIGPHEIWVMITKWEFELYLGLTAALIITLMCLSGKYGNRTILIDLGLVGLFGGYTALSTKGVASLLSFTLWHVITFPISYLLAAVLICSALMQIRYINRALQRFDSTQVIPTQFVLFTLAVIIGSAVLYRDFESTTKSRAMKFVGGCALTFLGVYFITSGRSRNEDEYSEGEEEDEEAEVGFVNGQRYRDTEDEPRALDQHMRKPGDTALENRHQSRSTRASFQSASSEGDDLNTPKGLLSPAGSDNEESISEDSLSQDLASSPPQPQSLIDNPWDSPEGTLKTTISDPLVHKSIPTTPPGSQTRVAQFSPILFRFPVAPSPEDAGQNSDTHSHPARSPQPSADIRTPENRRRSTPRTPQSSVRNSVQLRLTPAPLIAPLSSTLSAVVADSLRRGEGSPGRHQRSKSVRVRRLGSAPLIVGETNGDSGENGYDTEYSVDGRHVHSSAVTVTPGSSRVNSNREVPRVNTTAADAIQINTKADADTSTKRLRSFSDSLSGGLAWLGGTLRRPRKSEGVVPTQSGGNESSEGDDS